MMLRYSRIFLPQYSPSDHLGAAIQNGFNAMIVLMYFAQNLMEFIVHTGTPLIARQPGMLNFKQNIFL